MPSNKTKVIIDCDPGCDDAVALFAALSSDLIDVIGITSIGGNVDPVRTQKNALGICALMGRKDVPVYAGCTKPLEKVVSAIADHVHGETGVHGLALPYGQAADGCSDMDATDFILKATQDHVSDPLTLIVIGPMTNVAQAYLRDPSVVDRVKGIVTMGGAYGNPGGNMSPYAEFNIFSDPLAAQIVYKQFRNIVALPLDVTHRYLQDTSFRDWLRGQGGHGDNFANMLDAYAADYPGLSGLGACPIHDFHTIAAILRPDLYSFKTGFVHVETRGEREGQTVLTEDAAGTCKVMIGLNGQAFLDVLKSCLSVACRKGRN